MELREWFLGLTLRTTYYTRQTTHCYAGSHVRDICLAMKRSGSNPLVLPLCLDGGPKRSTNDVTQRTQMGPQSMKVGQTVE